MDELWNDEHASLSLDRRVVPDEILFLGEESLAKKIFSDLFTFVLFEKGENSLFVGRSKGSFARRKQTKSLFDSIRCIGTSGSIFGGVQSWKNSKLGSLCPRVLRFGS